MSWITWGIGVLVPLVHLAGAATAVEAVLKCRSSQGAIAWSIALITFPYLALPLYWVFGHRRFHGYVIARRSGDLEINELTESLLEELPRANLLRDDRGEAQAAERLARMPITKNNHLHLLVDGEATFGAIFEGISGARDYILVQFFIVKDDELGRSFKQALIGKAQEGVRVYFVYDEVGSRDLPRGFLDECRAAGIDIRPFNTRRGHRNRFQVNFRNHRKIVVVDGRVGFVGGLNVGDEYMGRNPRFGRWRDTHVRIEGPAVQAVQLSFVEDWYWAAREIPELDWKPRAAPDDDQNVLVLSTGPADEVETCLLFFVEAINSARDRIWISSPYFVPDEAVVAALQLAGLRGVDVRIMLPEKIDHLLVYLSGFSYLEDAEKTGVRIFRYQPGFLHQKVLLVDDTIAAVGTANLDNRSFRLNFEITIIAGDRGFASEVEAMLAADFEGCREASAADLERRPFWFKLGVRLARLLSPVL